MQVGDRLFLSQAMDGWNKTSEMFSRTLVLPSLTLQQQMLNGRLGKWTLSYGAYGVTRSLRSPVRDTTEFVSKRGHDVKYPLLVV